MFYLILIILGVLFLRCIFCVKMFMDNPHKSIKYSVLDCIEYVSHRKYNVCPVGEIVAFVGLFGKGKTLSAVHKIVSLYKRYNNKKIWCTSRNKFVTQKIKILSNVHLNTLPYEKLITLDQIILCSENNKKCDMENDIHTVTLVLGDEFSTQLNSRNFKNNFDSSLLNTILTSRHHDISIFYTAQRFSHVDALLRQVTSYVVSCNKIWRYMQHCVYDAWDLENAGNVRNIQPLGEKGFFILNEIYNAYDTKACVENLIQDYKNGNRLTEQEILALQCNTNYNMDVIEKPSKRYFRNRKQKK